MLIEIPFEMAGFASFCFTTLQCMMNGLCRRRKTEDRCFIYQKLRFAAKTPVFRSAFADFVCPVIFPDFPVPSGFSGFACPDNIDQDSEQYDDTDQDLLPLYRKTHGQKSGLQDRDDEYTEDCAGKGADPPCQ